MCVHHTSSEGVLTWATHISGPHTEYKYGIFLIELHLDKPQAKRYRDGYTVIVHWPPILPDLLVDVQQPLHQLLFRRHLSGEIESSGCTHFCYITSCKNSHVNRGA